MKNIILILLPACICGFASAQSPVLTEVKIEFERKVNVWATMGGFGEELKNSIPQYSSTYYIYETDGNKALYKQIPKENNSRGFFMMASQTEDAVFTDFQSKEQIALKSVFEKNYLLSDTLRHIDWKLTNDFREIAGFNCRRATAVIMDSVFVVAFYTDEIVPSGGPESFTGLPGMIMGLVINRLHTTWYATKVSVTDVNRKEIVPPAASRAEKINRAKLSELLQQRFQNNGGFGRGDQMIWNLMI